MELEDGNGNGTASRDGTMRRPMDDSSPMQQEPIIDSVALAPDIPPVLPKEEESSASLDNQVVQMEIERLPNDTGEENLEKVDTPQVPNIPIDDDRKPPPKEIQQQQESTPLSVVDSPTKISTVEKPANPPTSVLELINNPQDNPSSQKLPEQPTGGTPLHPPASSNGISIKTEILPLSPNALKRKEMRRKNRRRLHRLLKKPGTLPSFLRVIEERKKIKKDPNPDVGPKDKETKNIITLLDDSDDEFLLEPPKVVIDVDEYLGLKKKRKFSEAVLSASLVPSNNSVISSSSSGNNPGGKFPSNVSSTTSMSTPQGISSSDSNSWYKGSRPMAIMPEDAMYLTENQQCIRKNMEFFTATRADSIATTTRKTPVVVGRVGFRCRHCAQAVREGRSTKMLPASVSFPKNYSALYNLTVQKQQMHIDTCPYVPFDMKNQGGTKSRKRAMTSLPAPAYWQISCRRIGVVEVDNNSGLRFARDPKLEPLPFESVRREVEQEQPNLVSRYRRWTNELVDETSPVVDRIAPAAVLSTNRIMGSPATASENSSIKNLPKAVVDVLAKARGEDEDLTNELISKNDAAVLSDFMFMTIKQATICHGSTEDFATRGKKTRLMRLGYAGFCCRHCKQNYSSNGSNGGINVHIFQNSCRSFSSTRDNVGSAMSNSFVLHLLKCQYTPMVIKQALQSLKRLHSKQMHRFPYGSQSAVFWNIWKRIRAADKPIRKGDVSPSPRRMVNSEEDELYVPDPVGSSTSSNQQVIALSDDEFRDVLKEMEENWEPSENDNLIQRQDRSLISDFVFLLMRQLKIAIPTGTDFRGRTKPRMAGVCCVHCSGTSQSTFRFLSSGRSFPSDPDRIKSMLNVTMYKHLINCRRTPSRIKGAIEAAQKTHRQQCSSFPFGSQRRYFERLYSRLTKVPLGGVLATASNEMIVQDDSEYRSTLQKCSFVRTKNSNFVDYWQCSKCRMVPYDYRAPGSIFLSRPTPGALKKHHMVCQKDSVDWGTIQASLRTLGVKYGGALSLVKRESFSDLIRSVVGNDAGVLDTYMTKLGKIESPQESFSDRYIWRKLPLEVDFEGVEESFSALRKDLDLPPASIRDCPDFLTFLRLVSVNFEIPPSKPLNGNNNGSILSSTAVVLDDQTTAHTSRHLNEEANARDQKTASVLERTTENLKQESTPISQKLTWDQGIDVMDNIESGQFDDA